MAPERQIVTSVKRAILLLRSFSLEEPELGVMELSRRLNTHKSTVSRLLATLQDEGLVDRNRETGQYRLGVGLLALSSLVLLHTDLRLVARPILNRLTEVAQETVNLAIKDDDEVINIEQVAPPFRRVLTIGWVGRHTPLHSSSTGKVLLSHLLDEELDAFLQKPLSRFTEHTITDAQKLRAELEVVRQRGYAAGLEELEIGLNALSAPIYDHTGKVIAAVSVSGPSYRLSTEKLEDLSTLHQAGRRGDNIRSSGRRNMCIDWPLGLR